MKDYLVKALAHDGFVRAYAVQATNTVAEHKDVMILGTPPQLLWDGHWSVVCYLVRRSKEKTN